MPPPALPSQVRQQFGSGVGVVKETVVSFLQDDCPAMAASLAYYTVFSLPPLLYIAISVAGLILAEEVARGEVQQQVEALVGARAAEQVTTMMESAGASMAEGPVRALVGLGVLLFGATAAFAQLQRALNRAWQVQPDPEQGGLKIFFFKRVLSFGMVLGIGFLLLVSLLISTLLAALASWLETVLPQSLSAFTLQWINNGVSFAVTTGLFASIYKILPDARIGWRDVGVGAAVTALLFTLGKFGIGLYLGRSDPGSAFGAAGSLAIILVWIYYSAMIVLIGAEFTQVWSRRYGRGIRPDRGAVRVVRDFRHAQDLP